MVYGYTDIKPFYNRVYKEQDETAYKSIDNRKTLYWNPLVILDKKK